MKNCIEASKENHNLSWTVVMEETDRIKNLKQTSKKTFNDLKIHIVSQQNSLECQ